MRPWRCFHELINDRDFITDGIGGGLGSMRIIARPMPIKWQTIHLWAQKNHCSPSQEEELHILVKALDNFYLKKRNDELNLALKNCFK